jgi:predicted RNase H-like nuclease
MSWVAGVDGFKDQWCLVLLHLVTGELCARIVPTFSDLLEIPERPLVLAVDIPIGLPEFTLPGGRACEREARRVLGSRASCVFSAVGRAPLRAPSRAEADCLSRAAGGIGIGAQAWGLAAKLREADAAMTPERQGIVFEVHSEVSFWAMNGRAPLVRAKKAPEGAKDRADALVRNGFPEVVHTLPSDLKVGRDDYLDACAAAWTARRVQAGQAGRFPTGIERDGRGLDMAIWY